MTEQEYEVRPKTYGPHVKVVCKPATAPSCDIVVLVRRPPGWEEVARFNDMSDDYALTNAHNRALYERRKILEGEA